MERTFGNLVLNKMKTNFNLFYMRMENRIGSKVSCTDVIALKCRLVDLGGA